MAHASGPIYGSSGTVYVGTAPGTTEAALATDWTYEESAPVTNVTYGGATSATSFVGVKTGSGTITFHWHPGDSSGQATLTTGSTVTVNLLPGGDNDDTNTSYWTGEVKISGISSSWSHEGVTGYTVSFAGVLTPASIDV